LPGRPTTHQARTILVSLSEEKKNVMEPRIDYSKHAPEAQKAMAALKKYSSPAASIIS
jgi:hypothetical protein